IRRAGFDFGADRRRHGEYAGVAPGHDRDICASGCVFECGGGPRLLFTVIGGMARLVGPRRYAIQIGAIAVDGLCGRQRRIGLRGEPAGICGPEADHGEATAHGRRSKPATSTVAKYGAQSSVLSARRMTTACAIVPCSTYMARPSRPARS